MLRLVNIAAAICSVISLLLNGVLCLAILQSRNSQSLKKYPLLPKILPFVSALAGLSSLPYLFVVISSTHGCTVGTLVAVGLARLVMGHVFIYITVWIAIDRAYSVMRPITYYARKDIMFWPMIISLPLPLMITVIFPLSAPKFDKLLESCILGLITGNTANKLYSLIFIGAAIIVMALAYLAFAVKLQYGSRMTNGTRLNGTMLVLLAITILFTFFPYAAAFVNYFVRVGWFATVGPLCELLTTVNQIAAFIVYNWKLPPMRVAVKRLFCLQSREQTPIENGSK